MSLVHYTPDPTVTPCVGCGERIAPDDLVRLDKHGWTSTFLWHPYHLWCVETHPERPRAEWGACTDCGEACDEDDLREIVAWGLTLTQRLGRRAFAHVGGGILESDVALPRPAPLRLVRALAEGSPPATCWLPEPQRRFELHLASLFDVAHADCDRGDDPLGFLARLRAGAGDDERRVYADWLESRGAPRRAAFVRAELLRHASADAERERCTEALRTLRPGLPSGWCRDVCARLTAQAEAEAASG